MQHRSKQLHNAQVVKFTVELESQELLLCWASLTHHKNRDSQTDGLGYSKFSNTDQFGTSVSSGKEEVLIPLNS